MSLITTPEDCIFVITKSAYFPDEWEVYVNIAAYFQNKGYQIDKHLQIEGFKWAQIQEAVFESPHEDPVKTHSSMLDFGFKFDPKFADFLEGLGNTVYKP